MSNWQYDSGGHSKDYAAYRENYEKIFGKPCPECGMKKGQHKMDCSEAHKDVEWDAIENK